MNCMDVIAPSSQRLVAADCSITPTINTCVPRAKRYTETWVGQQEGDGPWSG